MTDRTNISVTDDVHERCSTLKRDDESWSAFLTRAADALEQTETDHTQTALTTAHIDDIAARVSRRTAEEVENRLTRR